MISPIVSQSGWRMIPDGCQHSLKLQCHARLLPILRRVGCPACGIGCCQALLREISSSPQNASPPSLSRSRCDPSWVYKSSRVDVARGKPAAVEVRAVRDASTDAPGPSDPSTAEARQAAGQPGHKINSLSQPPPPARSLLAADGAVAAGARRCVARPPGPPVCPRTGLGSPLPGPVAERLQGGVQGAELSPGAIIASDF